MRYKLSILLSLMLPISCKDQTQEKTEIVSENETVSEKSTVEIKSEPELSDCDKYWMNRFPKDSIKVNCINEIISKTELSENNLKFLNGLKNGKQENLALESVLSTIFRLSNTEIGIFTFPKYKNVL
jgi:hypothetical protein